MTNEESIKKTIHHEYIHAWQTCRKMKGMGKDDKLTCEQSICAEIQASSCESCVNEVCFVVIDFVSQNIMFILYVCT